ncbi:MAG: right-handed parallel beta-helix repeat-containing protein [Candidatus Thorarchaeota archaeon]
MVYVIENVTIDATNSPTGSGIFIENSMVSFIIRNCSVYNANNSAAGYAGIRLRSTYNGILINNNCSDNGMNGIILGNDCRNNIVSGNIANKNAQYGIYLSSSSFNTISGNNENENTQSGIYIRNSENNYILQKMVARNPNGISLIDDSKFNSVSENTVANNQMGCIFMLNIGVGFSV